MGASDTRFEARDKHKNEIKKNLKGHQHGTRLPAKRG